MNKYGLTIFVVVAYAILVIWAYPQVYNSLALREKKCTDETAKLEQTRKDDANLTLLQAQLVKENAPYAKANQALVTEIQTYTKPEDAQKIIINEADHIGLKIGPSKLQSSNIEIQTMEGVTEVREFVIIVEGSHQSIGEWLARSEALVRTCRPEDMQMYPLGPTVGARVQFYLLAGVMTPNTKELEAK